jgi:transketolase
MVGTFSMSTMATGRLLVIDHNTSLQLTTYSDLEGIYASIAEGRKIKDKPTLIRLRTTIGYGSKEQGTHGVHGTRTCLFRENQEHCLDARFYE